jgi:flagellar hook protein FlgE
MSNYAIALSGLQNTSSAIDSVSNNIANANTVGYKAGEYLFADQFVRAVNPSDTARVGMGVQTLGVRRALTQGTITNSSNQLDMAISGSGMFRLLKGSGFANSVDPSAVFYSRNGQFAVDKEGYIVNENGMYLTGFQPTLDGSGITDDLIKNNGLLKMPQTNLPGVESTYSTVSAILDSRADAFTSTANIAFDPLQNTFNNKTTQTVFDSQGNTHTLEVFYRRVNDDNLIITSDATGKGYLYEPSKSSEPNTLGQTQVTINSNSVLRVDTASFADALSASRSTGTSISLRSLPSKANTDYVQADLVDKKIFVNGIDSGATVTGLTSANGVVTLTANGNVDVPAGANVSFYNANAAGTVGSYTAGESTLTLGAAVTGVNVNGYRVFVGGVDTAVTVKSGGNTTALVLSGQLDPVPAANAAIQFRPTLDMTLQTPDGTSVTMSGTTNQPSSGTKLISTMARVEVYASLNGTFYDYNNGQFTSNRTLMPATPGVGGLTGNGYQAVSELKFVGGRNIDSLFTEGQAATPQFRTLTKLSAMVENQAGGRSDLVFDLDLSDTSLQAGAFQITASRQNGEAVARLTNVTVDNQGRIVGIYGTGKQQYVGQLALVHFDNFEGLIPVGKNAFAASIDSGTEHSASGVVVGRAGTGIFGEVKSQALESSNVDLANELVRLMVLQRSYTANSQSMRAFDQTLRDTLQMIS